MYKKKKELCHTVAKIREFDIYFLINVHYTPVNHLSVEKCDSKFLFSQQICSIPWLVNIKLKTISIH